MLTLDAQAQTNWGTPGVITTIAPGSYTGQYLIHGDIYLTNGTYNFTDASLEFDGLTRRKTATLVQVVGSRLIIGPNATVVIDHSILEPRTATLWYGIFFEPNQPG